MTRDELIEEYLPYAKERARYWSYRHPSLREDILSVAMLALVETFNRLVPDNPKAYLSLEIKRAVDGLIRSNDLIIIPSYELQKRKASKQSLDDLPKAMLLGDIEDHRHSKDPPVWVLLHIKDVGEILELTDREKRIIELKTEGCTNEEIGVEFSISEVAIRKVLKKLQGRYLVAMREHPGMLRPNESEA